MTNGAQRVIVFAATSVERRLFPSTPGVESIQTGMGAVASAEAFHRALRLNISGAVSFGFAGALRRELSCGTLLLPRGVQSSAGRRLDTDPRWHERVLSALLQSGMSADVRDIAQTEQILDGARSKTAVARDTLAAAVDMESSSLGEQARAHGIPFLVLRVVLDELEDQLPACLGQAVSTGGGVAPTQLLGSLLREPSAIGPLVRLALRRRVAARRLRSAAGYAGPALGRSTPPPGSE